MLLALVIVLPTLGFGLAFIGIAINGGTSDLIEIISVLMAFPSVAMLWLAMCCCSEYWVSINIMKFVVYLLIFLLFVFERHL